MKDFIDEVKKAIKEKGTSQKKLSKELNINTSALSQYLNGIYTGDSDSIEAKLKNWLGDMAMVSEEQLATSTLQLDDEWRPTETANRIWFALQFAYTESDFTFVCTDPGMGKTVTATKFAQEHKDAYLVTMTSAETTVPNVIQALAYGLGSKHKASKDDNLNYIKSKLLGTDIKGHLVIDEAQHLTAKGVEILRSIHDLGIGLTLLGNVGVYNTIAQGNKKHDYGQIFSRIGLSVVRENITKKDVDVLLKGWGISDPEITTFLTKVGQGSGALRNIKKRLKLANIIAMGAGEEMNLDHIRQAEANNAFSR